MDILQEGSKYIYKVNFSNKILGEGAHFQCAANTHLPSYLHEKFFDIVRLFYGSRSWCIFNDYELLDLYLNSCVKYYDLDQQYREKILTLNTESINI